MARNPRTAVDAQLASNRQLVAIHAKSQMQLDQMRWTRSSSAAWPMRSGPSRRRRPQCARKHAAGDGLAQGQAAAGTARR